MNPSAKYKKILNTHSIYRNFIWIPGLKNTSNDYFMLKVKQDKAIVIEFLGIWLETINYVVAYIL